MKHSKSGSANFEIERIISIFLEHLKKSCFRIQYISCDGDRFYNKFFENQFNLIYKTIKDKSFETFCLEISKIFPIWISNPFHLFKNGRSRILNNNIIINPYVESCFFNAAEINDVLNLGNV